MTAFLPILKPSLIVSPGTNSKVSMANSLLHALTPEQRHTFIAPPSSLPDASLAFAKETLDAFAGKLGDEQLERLKVSRRKRKRGEVVADESEVLKIRKLHIEGFEVEQVWEQARRVIDALRRDAEQGLGQAGVDMVDSAGGQKAEGAVEALKFDVDGFEIGSGDDSAGDDEEGVEASESEDGADAEPITFGEDGEEVDFGEEPDNYEDEEEDGGESTGFFVEDPNGLNDGFFSIDEFNKQTEFLEQQDAAADPYTGEASDEEDIDWDANPLNMTVQPVSNVRRAKAMDIDEEDEDSIDDEEDGPTFGNVDLNAPEGDSDDGEEDDEIDQDADTAGDNTNEVLYKDFFEPPPRKAGKGERQADYLERQARNAKFAEPGDEAAEMERAVADVRRDLFDDLSDQDNSEEALSYVDVADPKSRKSAHERRQAKLAEEIRRLEAASVAKRQWTLAGEARATDRPMNSLLEEDLDFERTGKPVPEITAEISESIEELIKRRILAQEFDEVIRRRPDLLNTPANTRRGLFELDDSKPQQSLAEVYEEEHVKAANPDTYVTKTDEKMRKEEKEIEALWKDVSVKLDALSSWHYKPKPVAPSLTIVSDVATITMEDVQPTTASGISGGESMLAPQEIYKAGKEQDSIEKGEVVPKNGAPIARQEMTREEKLRRRRREKERIKKRGGEEPNQRPARRKTKQKKDTLGDLKKSTLR